MTDSRASAIAAVIRAIKDEGREPAYHREIMARHRREWPTLWKALDALLLVGPPMTPEQVRHAVSDARDQFCTPYEDIDSVRSPGWYAAECDICQWTTSGTESVVDDTTWEHMHDSHPSYWQDGNQGYRR